jgi:hypothetical protein
MRSSFFIVSPPHIAAGLSPETAVLATVAQVQEDRITLFVFSPVSGVFIAVQQLHGQIVGEGALVLGYS